MVHSGMDVTSNSPEGSLRSICESLRGRGVVAVEASYYGGGDEGAVQQIDYLPEGIKVPDDLGESLEDWICECLPNCWEIGDGGQGAVRIDVVAATAHFDHEVNVMTTEDESFDIGGK
jgi:hypothetical protein